MSLRERVLGRIREEREKCEKATAEEWFAVKQATGYAVVSGFQDEVVARIEPWAGVDRADAEFIASARTLLPALLAEAQRQVEEHAPWPDTDDCRCCSNESVWPMSECPIITGWARVFGEGE